MLNDILAIPDDETKEVDANITICLSCDETEIELCSYLDLTNIFFINFSFELIFYANNMKKQFHAKFCFNDKEKVELKFCIESKYEQNLDDLTQSIKRIKTI